MKHTYKIQGMSCTGCTASVEDSLSNLKEIQSVKANLENGTVEIEMLKHVSLEKLQETLLKSGLHYTFENTDKNQQRIHQKKEVPGTGVFYCPMQCEGEKTYDKPGDCSICGMDLIEQPKSPQETRYTCPMHPEIIENGPGSCPICGMDLVPMEPTESEEDVTYKKLLRKMKIALLFTVPIFLIAMSDMLPNNFLLDVFSQKVWNWIQFFFHFLLFFMHVGCFLIVH